MCREQFTLLVEQQHQAALVFIRPDDELPLLPSEACRFHRDRR
jgi:hypothetical protein